MQATLVWIDKWTQVIPATELVSLKPRPLHVVCFLSSYHWSSVLDVAHVYQENMLRVYLCVAFEPSFRGASVAAQGEC